MGNFDMWMFIVYGLGWFEWIELGVLLLDLVKVVCLDFQVFDLVWFFCLKLVKVVMQEGKMVLVVFNVVNEIVV